MSEYGNIERGDSRRRRKKKDTLLRSVLGVLLISVLVLGAGWMGINALTRITKGKQPVETKPVINTEAPTEPSSQVIETEPATTEAPETTTAAPTKVMANGAHAVWLDAGHGGTDWGTAQYVRNEQGQILDSNGNVVPEGDNNSAYTHREKADTLEIILILQKELEDRGVTVYMTRTDDTYVERHDRAYAANATDAECFVSIHRDYESNLAKCGIQALLCNTQTWAEEMNKHGDDELAQFIFDELAKVPNNGLNGTKRETVKSEDISVLLYTDMPAILLELGYMSNDSDDEMFHQYMNEYASAIADGVVNWLNWRG